VIQKLETYQRQTLKQLQHFPPNNSNPATYLRSGVIPVHAEVDQRILSTFGRLARSTGSAERELIRRQINIKNLSSNSWTANVKLLTHKYQLPSVYEIMDNSPTKDQWKRQVKHAIQKYHRDRLLQDMQSQSSARYINPNSCSLTNVHPVWKYCGSHTREITRATIKAKILVGAYNLEGKRSKFGRGENGQCQLCRTDMETREHFLVKCTALEHIRKPYIEALAQLVVERVGEIEATFHLSPSYMTRTILDPSHVAANDEFLYEAEQVTRRLCYALHHNRLFALSEPQSTQTSTTTAYPAVNGVRLIKAEYHRTR
jgi:hypothetical protein